MSGHFQALGRQTSVSRQGSLSSATIMPAPSPHVTSSSPWTKYPVSTPTHFGMTPPLSAMDARGSKVPRPINGTKRREGRLGWRMNIPPQRPLTPEDGEWYQERVPFQPPLTDSPLWTWNTNETPSPEPSRQSLENDLVYQVISHPEKVLKAIERYYPNLMPHNHSMERAVHPSTHGYPPSPDTLSAHDHTTPHCPELSYSGDSPSDLGWSTGPPARTRSHINYSKPMQAKNKTLVTSASACAAPSPLSTVATTPVRFGNERRSESTAAPYEADSELPRRFNVPGNLKPDFYTCHESTPSLSSQAPTNGEAKHSRDFSLHSRLSAAPSTCSTLPAIFDSTLQTATQVKSVKPRKYQVARAGHQNRGTIDQNRPYENQQACGQYIVKDGYVGEASAPVDVPAKRFITSAHLNKDISDDMAPLAPQTPIKVGERKPSSFYAESVPTETSPDDHSDLVSPLTPVSQLRGRSYDNPFISANHQAGTDYEERSEYAPSPIAPYHYQRNTDVASLQEAETPNDEILSMSLAPVAETAEEDQAIDAISVQASSKRHVAVPHRARRTLLGKPGKGSSLRKIKQSRPISWIRLLFKKSPNPVTAATEDRDILHEEVSGTMPTLVKPDSSIQTPDSNLDSGTSQRPRPRTPAALSVAGERSSRIALTPASSHRTARRRPTHKFSPSWESTVRQINEIGRERPGFAYSEAMQVPLHYLGRRRSMAARSLHQCHASQSSSRLNGIPEGCP